MAPSNFTCDSCRQGIAAPNPRVHCLSCPDYDLCANCFLGERYTNGHQVHHSTQVFKRSGGNGQPAIPASAPTDAPRSLNTPAPPPPHSPTPPALPARRGNVPPSMPNPGPTHQTATQWQYFYNADGSATPFFIGLINDIFTYLDPANNGNLEPETLSRFLDDMGYSIQENAWKVALKPSMGCSAESMADKSLKNIFDLFSIEHVLLQRIQPKHVDPTGLTSQFSRLFGPSINPSMFTNPADTPGPMPAITRNGFLELRRIDGLTDPSKEWGNISRLLRKYNLPKYAGFGDLPRSMMPNSPDPVMLKRVADITAFAQLKGQQELDAARASAQLAAQGRQAAVDLIDGTRREYRYTYI